MDINVKLTDNQRFWLRSMVSHGGRWNAGAYYWGSYSATVRICDALVKKGLVVKQGEADYIVNGEHPYVIDLMERQAAQKAAHDADMARREAEWEQQERRDRAHRDAVEALIIAHPEEFDALVAKALAAAE